MTYYEEIQQDFPDVKLHMVKNKNYEYGAWKYIVNRYPDFDIYFCIQDTLSINKYIDLSVVNDTTAYTFHHHSGYNSHQSVKAQGIEQLKGTGLSYESIIDDNFTLAQHCSFIVTNQIIKDIFKYFTVPPVNKDGECFYERNFGIYFLNKKITTIDLTTYMDKINGLRQ